MSDGWRDEHASLTVQRDMREIAGLLPELDAALAGGGGTDASGVRRPPGSKPPISLHVADVTVEIQAWVTFLARVLIDETDWLPASDDTRDILDDIATNRIGHFTAHADEMLALSVTEDAARLARLARNTARPSGRRRIPLHIPCAEHTTSDLGERVPCPGHLVTTLAPGERLGDFVCDRVPGHRMAPLEWQRGQRRDVARDRDMDALVFGGRVRYTSERIGA